MPVRKMILILILHENGPIRGENKFIMGDSLSIIKVLEHTYKYVTAGMGESKHGGPDR